MDVVVLSARREYEFAADSVRLSVLNVPEVRMAVQQAFAFAEAGTQANLTLFEPWSASYPPAVAWFLGRHITTDRNLVPIRSLGFDVRHLVVDVAAPSHRIDAVYDALQEVLSAFRTEDGHPLVGKPLRVRDFSELSFQAPSPIPVPTIAERLVHAGALGQGDREWLFTFSWQATNDDGKTPGESNAPGYRWTVSPRVNTRPDEHHYYSAAPLPDDAHRRLIHQLWNLPDP
jgi:hypothetical protein